MVLTTYLTLLYIVGVLVSIAITAYEVQQDMLKEGNFFTYWDCFDAVMQEPHVVFLASWVFVLGVIFYNFFIKETKDEE